VDSTCHGYSVLPRTNWRPSSSFQIASNLASKLAELGVCAVRPETLLTHDSHLLHEDVRDTVRIDQRAFDDSGLGLIIDVARNLDSDDWHIGLGDSRSVPPLLSLTRWRHARNDLSQQKRYSSFQ
jgi:hypothetical protein